MHVVQIDPEVVFQALALHHDGAAASVAERLAGLGPGARLEASDVAPAGAPAPESDRFERRTLLILRLR